MATAVRVQHGDKVIGWLVGGDGAKLRLQPAPPPPSWAGNPRWPHYAVQMLKREAMDVRPRSSPPHGDRWLQQLAGISDDSELETGPLPEGLPPAVEFGVGGTGDE